MTTTLVNALLVLHSIAGGKNLDSADSGSKKSIEKCQEQLESINLITDRPKIGAFTPRCNDNGDFQPRQCHGSTGQCWCVDTKSGQELPNTRTKPGQSPINCDGKIGNCRAERERLLAQNVPPGTFVPACSMDGTYSPLQCHGSTGYCWCVDPQSGQEVNGTRTAPGQEQSLCLESTNSKVCPVGEPLKDHSGEEVLCSFTSDDVMCPENYTCVPRDPAITLAVCCTSVDKPTIEPRIVESVKQKDPNEYKSAKANNFADLLSENKDNVKDGLCTQRLQSILNAHRSLVGVFVPRCDYDGSYAALQCHGSVGNCWCVTADGTEIPATRVGPGGTRPNCQKARSQEISGTEQLPVIQEPGVTKTARKRSSTTIPPFLNTDGPCHKTVRSLSVNVEPTVFIPRCTPTGFYQPLQCHGPDLCWCSTADGLEISGSRVPPGCGFPDCDNFSKNESADTPGHMKPAAIEPSEPHEDIGDFLPICTLPRETGLCKASMIRYYFSPEHRTCLAFTYGGCGGNDNNFMNRTSCLHTCLPADYGSCYGTQKAYHGPLSTKAPRPNEHNHGCLSDEECPTGYKCKFAGLINFCCNKTIEDEWSESYNFQCPNNVEPYKDDEDSVLLSDRCGNNGFCPLSHVCRENKHFGYCCRQSLGNHSASDDKLQQPINDFCQLPKDSGTVQSVRAGLAEPVKRWFYNINTKNCESFLYNLNGGGNRNNFESLTECLERCGQNQTISSSIEPAPTQITGKGEEQEEIDPKGRSICDSPKNQGSTCYGSAANVATEIRWYFNKEKFACVAFKYKGCGGNANNFRTKGQCDMRCKPQDGPNCSGNVRSYQTINGTSLQAKNCKELKCPTDWTCRMGWIFATCCNKTVEAIFDDAYNETCKNGAKAFTIARPMWSEPYFGDACEDLLCPSGYTCVQSTPMFAKCCSTTTLGKVQIAASIDDPNSTKIVQESIEDDKFKCPVGSPVIDELNFEYRSCDLNNTCPEYAYCWTGSTSISLDDDLHAAGFCCSVPKIPSLLQTTIAKQNCSSSVEKQLVECAIPIANLTKYLHSTTSVAAAASSSATAMKPSILLTSHEFRIRTLNESCSMYEGYQGCTSYVFKSDESGYCYNYIDSIINAILGFVCQPKIRTMLELYHKCLEGIIDHPLMKECVATFNETVQRQGVNLGDTPEPQQIVSPPNTDPSFSGICFAIENFVNCSQPLVAETCSAELSTTITQFVQKASIAIFGGTCEQIAASDAATPTKSTLNSTSGDLASKTTDQSSPDIKTDDQSKCTQQQTDQLYQCWQRFTNVSTVAYFFSPHSNPDELIRKEDVDALDVLCNTYQAYNSCATVVISANPSCSPSVYVGLSRVIAATCEPDALKNWKKFGYCYAELSSRSDVQKCLTILRSVQRVYSVDRGVNVPFDQLCSNSALYVQCSLGPIADKCGTEAADFYAESYERNKKLIFPPCLTQGLESAKESAHGGSSGSESSTTTVKGNLQNINDARYH